MWVVAAARLAIQQKWQPSLRPFVGLLLLWPESQPPRGSWLLFVFRWSWHVGFRRRGLVLHCGLVWVRVEPPDMVHKSVLFEATSRKYLPFHPSLCESSVATCPILYHDKKMLFVFWFFSCVPTQRLRQCAQKLELHNVLCGAHLRNT